MLQSYFVRRSDLEFARLVKARVPIKGYLRRGPHGQMVNVDPSEQERREATPTLAGFGGRQMPSTPIRHKGPDKGTEGLPLFNLTKEAEERRQADAQMPLFGTPQPGAIYLKKKEPEKTSSVLTSTQESGTVASSRQKEEPKMEARGTLALEKFVKEGKTVIRVIVRGNVGAEGREKLNALGMTPVVDIANTREKFVTTPQELDALREALVSQGIVQGPQSSPPQKEEPKMEQRDFGKETENERQQRATNLSVASSSNRKITRSTQGNYIVSFPYDAALVAAVKKIPGARFQPGPKNWVVPKEQESALTKFADEHRFVGLGKTPDEEKERPSQSQAHPQRMADMTPQERDRIMFGADSEEEEGLPAPGQRRRAPRRHWTDYRRNG